MPDGPPSERHRFLRQPPRWPANPTSHDRRRPPGRRRHPPPHRHLRRRPRSPANPTSLDRRRPPGPRGHGPPHRHRFQRPRWQANPTSPQRRSRPGCSPVRSRPCPSWECPHRLRLHRLHRTRLTFSPHCREGRACSELFRRRLSAVASETSLIAPPSNRCVVAPGATRPLPKRPTPSSTGDSGTGSSRDTSVSGRS